MGRNNQNNNHQSQNKPMKKSGASSSKSEVADTSIGNIVSASEKLWMEIAEKAIVEGELSEEMKLFLEKAENEQSIKDLLSYLLELVKDYHSIKKEVEKINHELVIEKAQLETSLAETKQKSDQASSLLSKNLAKEEELTSKESQLVEWEGTLNGREDKITLREDNYTQGKYTSVVAEVFERLRTAKEKIVSETESLIMSLADASKQYDAKATEYANKLAELEKKNIELDFERTVYQKAKESLKEDRDNIEEAAREILRDEYINDLASKDNEIDRLTRIKNKLEAESKVLREMVEKIQAAFDGKDPQEMAKDYDAMKSEYEKVVSELSSAPTAAQLSRLQLILDEREAKIEELEGLLDRQMILDEEKRHDQTQFNLSEINRLKDQLETAKYIEERYKENLRSLQAIIDEMKADKIKCQEAFRFARMYDDDPDIQSTPSFGTDPNGLYGLVDYVQDKLALEIDEVGDKKKALFYDKDIIRFFIAGLNMSQISILQGNSGTGKTSLPREFIKAITAGIVEYYGNNEAYDEPNAPYRVCEVQAGWRDNMDLMGYYNSFEKRYYETKFFKALYLANTPKYKDSLFFIILDEMNLSRPEHYFADFLSLLEQNEGERFVDVHVTEQEALPKLAKNGKLCVPKNVRFIGTANHDETTLEFAPKTYDRSHVIDMPDEKGKVDNPKDMTRSISYSWLEKEFKKAESEYEVYFLIFKDFINNTVHDLFVKKGIGKGNRFEEQAFRFITAFIASGDEEKVEESLAKASDHLITRRLFRTLRGNYDIGREDLKKFKDDYENAFFSTFNDFPHIAIEFLDKEIKNKKS